MSLNAIKLHKAAAEPKKQIYKQQTYYAHKKTGGHRNRYLPALENNPFLLALLSPSAGQQERQETKR